MNRIIVTPAGRESFLSILVKYVNRAKENNEFDEWHLWCNTGIQSDIFYIQKLVEEYDFIKFIPLCITPTYVGDKMIHASTIPYFYSVDSTDENAVYIRMDDDIIFIKNGSIGKLFSYRIDNIENFLIFGNVINNVAIANIHQNIGVLPLTLGKVDFDYYNYLALYDANFVEFTHNNFFEKYNLKLLDQYYFEPFVVENFLPVAVQVIAWRGEDYKKFGGLIPPNVHEEPFQSSIRPKQENRKTVIYGDGLFSHYSAAVTRNYIDTTDLYGRYKNLSEEYLK
jgi:hypothetical protein